VAHLVKKNESHLEECHTLENVWRIMKNMVHLEKCVDVAHLEKRGSFGQMRHI